VAAFAALGVDHPSRPPCIRGHGPEWRYENAAGESVCRRCERERSRNYYQRHRGKEVD
jgi:hypothetical protein